ncbi:MAG: hypothetical protein AADX96_25895 [Thiocapsa sp. C3-sup]|uniref:hypothetical protein n=1 Tax=Thiocapsa sp. C3-sup TaxID=3137396 RepID=UPI0035B1E9EF
MTERTDERGETETLLQFRSVDPIWVTHWDKELLNDNVKYSWRDMQAGAQCVAIRSEVAKRVIADGEWAFVRMSWGASSTEILEMFSDLIDLSDAMRTDGLAFRLWLDGEITREHVSAEAERQRQRAGIGRAVFGAIDAGRTTDPD